MAGYGLRRWWRRMDIGRPARVAEWQTQRTQNPPGATPCEFDSRLGHNDIHADLRMLMTRPIVGTAQRAPVEYFVDEQIVSTQPMLMRPMQVERGEPVLPRDRGLGFD